MYYTVYKIVNVLNGKFYIGKHQTRKLDDGYMGSGKRICHAIKKYGIENFKKEILFVFDSEDEMNEKEKELVVLNEQSYNLCEGGRGGFSYINQNNIPKFKGRTHSEESRKKISDKRKGFRHTEESRKKISDRNKETNQSRGNKTSVALKGKPKTEEHRRKISEALKKKHAALVYLEKSLTSNQ